MSSTIAPIAPVNAATTPCKHGQLCKRRNCWFSHEAPPLPPLPSSSVAQQQSNANANANAKPKTKAAKPASTAAAAQKSYVPPSERPLCKKKDCKDGDCPDVHQTQWEREFSNGWREVTTVVRYRVVIP